MYTARDNLHLSNRILLTILPDGQSRNYQTARAGRGGVQRRWPALPRSLSQGQATLGPDPRSPLPWCSYHKVPAQSPKSHTHRVLATKNTQGLFQIWSGAPSSPSEFQAVLFLGRSAVLPLLPYPRPPKQTSQAIKSMCHQFQPWCFAR